MTRDETANAVSKDGKSLRRSFGLVGGGYSIPLAQSDFEKPLLVGEGMETVQSGRQVTGLPGIAVRSAGNMGRRSISQLLSEIINPC